MSRQDRSVRGAERPNTRSIVYDLQKALPFSTAEDGYILRDRRLLDQAAAHILQLEEAVRLLKEQLSAKTPPS